MEPVRRPPRVWRGQDGALTTVREAPDDSREGAQGADDPLESARLATNPTPIVFPRCRRCKSDGSVARHPRDTPLGGSVVSRTALSQDIRETRLHAPRLRRCKSDGSVARHPRDTLLVATRRAVCGRSRCQPTSPLGVVKTRGSGEELRRGSGEELWNQTGSSGGSGIQERIRRISGADQERIRTGAQEPHRMLGTANQFATGT